MQYQVVENEMPFYPPSAAGGLGLAYRGSTDNFVSTSGGVAIFDSNYYSDWAQRNSTLEQVYANARNPTETEMEARGTRGGGDSEVGHRADSGMD
jgi:hypothetical protein